MPFDLFQEKKTMNTAIIAPALDAGTVASRAMLVRLKISQWGSRKLDKQVTDEVAADKKAATDAGRYNKALLSKSALAPIQAVISAARDYHMTHTLPWFDDAYRALPSAEFLDYTNAMRDFKGKFDSAVAALAADLPKHIADDRARLGGMFDPNDYPTPDQLRETYSLGHEFKPIPVGADFRVDMSPEQKAQIAADIEARTMGALQIAQNDLWQRAHDTVKRMAERLRAYVPADGDEKALHPFRDTLVTNIREIAALLPRLNVAGDPNLTALAVKLEEELAGYEAQDLRESTTARESVAQSAEDILKAMAGYVGQGD